MRIEKYVRHNGVENLVKRIHDELNETSLEFLALVLVRKFSGLGVVESSSPEVSHHHLLLDTELLGVQLGEENKRESPLMKTTSERDSSFAGIHENVLHTSESLCERVVAVRVDQNVHVLDNTSKILVALLRIHVQLEKNTIELVAHDHGLDSLGKSLSENCFRLHGDTLDAIDDDQGSVLCLRR